ncbi:MAG: VanW family protein, partial [Candidatus Obscuribacterales bacterium]|nr:VanW family protein [Candidatus Obscuribacterales bacterium]
MNKDKNGCKKSSVSAWTYSICLLPVILLAIYFQIRPFSDFLAKNSASLACLERAQKINIRLAATKINGFILKPGKEFSFNHVVGPRTYRRGFVAAPGYQAGRTVLTEGGAVCLVSSLLYKSALEAGLNVTERKSHSRPIRSIAPGFDATVLYPRHDLKIRNQTSEPIIFQLSSSANEVKIAINGRRTEPVVILSNQARRGATGRLSVSVHKQQNGKT